MGRVEIITGRERRRRWPEEEKLRILEEAMAPGVSMAEVARRHDLYPQQLYTWRRLFAEPDCNSWTMVTTDVADDYDPTAEAWV